jgi:hypothetical protein
LFFCVQADLLVVERAVDVEHVVEQLALNGPSSPASIVAKVSFTFAGQANPDEESLRLRFPFWHPRPLII